MQLALLEISLCSSVILPLWRGPKAATTQKQTFPAEGLLPKSQPASQQETWLGEAPPKLSFALHPTRKGHQSQPRTRPVGRVRVST